MSYRNDWARNNNETIIWYQSNPIHILIYTTSNIYTYNMFKKGNQCNDDSVIYLTLAFVCLLVCLYDVCVCTHACTDTKKCMFGIHVMNKRCRTNAVNFCFPSLCTFQKISSSHSLPCLCFICAWAHCACISFIFLHFI